jgi:hypothetical protein
MANVTITFRPLTQWPAGRKRTDEWAREDAKFKAPGRSVNDGLGGSRWVQGSRTPIETTYDEMDRELWAIGATDVVVQVDVRSETDFRRDTSAPRADARVSSPAVVLTFKRKGTVYTFACDRFKRWQDNLRGIVLGLEGLRRLERYGIVQSGEQYRGWQALPATTQAALSTETAADVIARRSAAGAGAILRDAAVTQQAVRAARAKAHPDAGGSASDFSLVQEAARVLGTHHGRTF